MSNRIQEVQTARSTMGLPELPDAEAQATAAPVSRKVTPGLYVMLFVIVAPVALLAQISWLMSFDQSADIAKELLFPRTSQERKALRDKQSGEDMALRAALNLRFAAGSNAQNVFSFIEKHKGRCAPQANSSTTFSCTLPISVAPFCGDGLKINVMTAEGKIVLIQAWRSYTCI